MPLRPYGCYSYLNPKEKRINFVKYNTYVCISSCSYISSAESVVYFYNDVYPTVALGSINDNPIRCIDITYPNDAVYVNPVDNIYIINITRSYIFSCGDCYLEIMRQLQHSIWASVVSTDVDDILDDLNRRVTNMLLS